MGPKVAPPKATHYTPNHLQHTATCQENCRHHFLGFSLKATSMRCHLGYSGAILATYYIPVHCRNVCLPWEHCTASKTSKRSVHYQQIIQVFGSHIHVFTNSSLTHQRHPYNSSSLHWKNRESAADPMLTPCIVLSPFDQSLKHLLPLQVGFIKSDSLQFLRRISGLKRAGETHTAFHYTHNFSARCGSIT